MVAARPNDFPLRQPDGQHLHLLIPCQRKRPQAKVIRFGDSFESVRKAVGRKK